MAESAIHLPESDLSITTTGFEPVEAGGPVSYVQSIAVNGKTLERPWISGRELRHIRNLHIELGPRPSGWGTQIRPPSTSDPLHAAAASKASRVNGGGVGAGRCEVGDRDLVELGAT